MKIGIQHQHVIGIPYLNSAGAGQICVASNFLVKLQMIFVIIFRVHGDNGWKRMITGVLHQKCFYGERGGTMRPLVDLVDARIC